MNDVKKFVNEQMGCSIRVSDRDGQPWFVGKDVADALGYANGSRDVKRHCKKSTVEVLQIRGQSRRVILIPESDVYRLIMRSDTKNSEEFQDWVTEEVLPSIRKHGAYMTEETATEMLEDPENVYTLARKLLEEHEARKKLELKEKYFGNRTRYGELSEETGLPRVQPVRGYLRSSRTGKGYEFIPDAIQLALFE